MNAIKDALLLIQRETLRRDKLVRELLKKGWRPSRIADKIGVSRQRAQQIIKRLNAD